MTAKKQFSIFLDIEDIEFLDELEEVFVGKHNRSKLIRAIVDRFIKEVEIIYRSTGKPATEEFIKEIIKKYYDR